jgi:phage shock protein PspC (stress-responsive transcriptional regulator)
MKGTESTSPYGGAGREARVAMATAIKRLHRSDDGIIAGVCAGIAEYIDVDAVVIRILAVLLTLVSWGTAIVVYLILWFAIPQENTVRSIDVSCGGQPKQDEEPTVMSFRIRLVTWLGSILIGLGFSFALDVLIVEAHWYQFWPILIVATALEIMVMPARNGKHSALRITSGLVMLGLGVLMLCCSLDFLAWETFPVAFSRMWPLLLAAIGFVIIGEATDTDAFIILAGVCVLLMCLFAMVLEPVVGPEEAITFNNPIGGEQGAGVNPWRA